MKTFEGSIENTSNYSIGIVASQYNREIVDNLVEGVLEVFDSYNLEKRTVYRVPGAYEIPLMLQRLAEQEKHDGYIALGCVIKGKTNHYDLINKHVQEGISQVILDYSVPVAFEVITAHNLKIAKERSDMNNINIGREAAQTILKTINVLKQVEADK